MLRIILVFFSLDKSTKHRNGLRKQKGREKGIKGRVCMYDLGELGCFLALRGGEGVHPVRHAQLLLCCTAMKLDTSVTTDSVTVICNT